MKNIYISGKITGDDSYRVKFSGACKCLEERGYRVLNPAFYISRDAVWLEAMRCAISNMVLFSDGVALLDDWEDSRGAKIEKRLAEDLSIPLKPLAEWLEAKK